MRGVFTHEYFATIDDFKDKAINNAAVGIDKTYGLVEANFEDAEIAPDLLVSCTKQNTTNYALCRSRVDTTTNKCSKGHTCTSPEPLLKINSVWTDQEGKEFQAESTVGSKYLLPEYAKWQVHKQHKQTNSFYSTIIFVLLLYIPKNNYRP